MKESWRSSSRARSIRASASILAWALAAGLAGVGGCGEGDGEPVARLAAEPMRLELPYGSYAELDLDWRVSAEPEEAAEPLRVFLHLLDADGDLARTFDHDVSGAWSAGREWRYTTRLYQSLLSPPLPPGAYALTGGLYDAEGRRWPVATESERVGRDEYRLATVEVPSRGIELPEVEFTGGWSPTLAGADRQVVAFRWLSGDGAIGLRELSERGTLWLGLRVPPEGGTLRRRMIGEAAEGGDGVPRVRIAAGCSGFEAQVSGEGRHDVAVPLTSADGSCEVVLEPNYVLDSPDEAGRSLLLEVLTWNPA